MDIKYWSSAAANNTSSAPDGAPEGMAPSGVNDTIREVMASVKRWYENAQWTDLGDTPTFATTASFTLAGNKKTIYETGRRIKAFDASTLYGTISDSTYSANTRVSVTLDSGQLSASLSSIAVSILSYTSSGIPVVAHAILADTATNANGANTASIALALSASIPLKVKVINIGDWDMDTDATKGVTHGLTYSKIRGVTATIRRDDDTYATPIDWPGTNTGVGANNSGWVYQIGATTVVLARLQSGYFDMTAYDATSFNRGWVTIFYEA